jgi:hypothetical protein
MRCPTPRYWPSASSSHSVRRDRRKRSSLAASVPHVAARNENRGFPCDPVHWPSKPCASGRSPARWTDAGCARRNPIVLALHLASAGRGRESASAIQDLGPMTSAGVAEAASKASARSFALQRSVGPGSEPDQRAIQERAHPAQGRCPTWKTSRHRA